MRKKNNRLDYIAEFTKEHYDLMPISLKNGMKDRIKVRSEQLGMNMSEYIRYCVEKEI